MPPSMPAPFLSVITDDCIRKGKDYNAGGARYNNTLIQLVGIGSITDSLAALKQLVFDKREAFRSPPLASQACWTAISRAMRRFASGWSTRPTSTATTTTTPMR